MRTTLNLDDNLIRAVKQQAAQTGSTMTGIIERALRELLASESKPAKPFRFRWVTVKGAAPPRVDVTDRDALLDYMEAGVGRR